ncbi:MAG: outer membrane lipoprotein-sorting protein [Candidatus Cloacimonetes bacterium]|nr:outer membrane lipoprotein-sorting protein [Candidatus Cloacimonadota bacterium]
MIRITSLILLLAATALAAQTPTGEELLRRIDDNLFAETVYMESKMVVHGRRNTRTIESRSWMRGEEDSFTEYTAPPREAGKKMLKLGDNLWTYDPDSDRIITISGNMLRQSVLGSDLSYEDMMEETQLTEMYSATVSRDTVFMERDCWVLELASRIDDPAYWSRMMLVDKERNLPLYEERYARSGKLLKTATITEVFPQPIQGRWYPRVMLYKDVLNNGEGTEFIIDAVEFDVVIPAAKMNKAALR